jgi:fumarate hydratase class II
VAVLYETQKKLVPAIESFIGKLKEVCYSFKGIVKPGRTHLRDALPVSIDMEFQAYLNSFSNTLNLIPQILKNISEVPIGGTAVGTGFNTHPDFPRKILIELNKITGLNLAHGVELSRGMRLITDLTTLSGILRTISLDLLRISQDIRLMYSGPLTGFGEIDIQQELPGSSMMPGKKNPVTVEAVMQAACQVIGLDYSNTLASTLGELELAMSFPLIGYNLILQILLVAEALNKFSQKVLSNIIVKKEHCRRLALKSPALITVVAPIIGYDNATKVAERMSKGLTLEDALKEIGLSDDKIKELLDKIMKTTPGFHL